MLICFIIQIKIQLQSINQIKGNINYQSCIMIFLRAHKNTCFLTFGFVQYYVCTKYSTYMSSSSGGSSFTSGTVWYSEVAKYLCSASKFSVGSLYFSMPTRSIENPLKFMHCDRLGEDCRSDMTVGWPSPKNDSPCGQTSKWRPFEWLLSVCRRAPWQRSGEGPAMAYSMSELGIISKL